MEFYASEISRVLIFLFRAKSRAFELQYRFFLSGRAQLLQIMKVKIRDFDRVAALSRIGCIFFASQNYTSANSPVFARSIGALHLQSPVFMSRKGGKDGLFGTSGILVFIPIVFILIAVDEYFF